MSSGEHTEVVAVRIRGAAIALGAFLKWAQAVDTGGAAKQLVRQGHVLVNGVTETRRRHLLTPGDTVALSDGRAFQVLGAGDVER